MIMHLKCLRCGEPFDMSSDAMSEVGYTKYSYCEKCLRLGLNQLKKTIEKENQEELREKNEKSFETENKYLPGYLPTPTKPFPINYPLTWACPWNDYFY